MIRVHAPATSFLYSFFMIMLSFLCDVSKWYTPRTWGHLTYEFGEDSWFKSWITITMNIIRNRRRFFDLGCSFWINMNGKSRYLYSIFFNGKFILIHIIIIFNYKILHVKWKITSTLNSDAVSKCLIGLFVLSEKYTSYIEMFWRTYCLMALPLQISIL